MIKTNYLVFAILCFLIGICQAQIKNTTLTAYFQVIQKSDTTLVKEPYVVTKEYYPKNEPLELIDLCANIQTRAAGRFDTTQVAFRWKLLKTTQFWNANSTKGDTYISWHNDKLTNAVDARIQTVINANFED